MRPEPGPGQPERSAAPDDRIRVVSPDGPESSCRLGPSRFRTTPADSATHRPEELTDPRIGGAPTRKEPGITHSPQRRRARASGTARHGASASKTSPGDISLSIRAGDCPQPRRSAAAAAASNREVLTPAGRSGGRPAGGPWDVPSSRDAPCAGGPVGCASLTVTVRLAARATNRWGVRCGAGLVQAATAGLCHTSGRMSALRSPGRGIARFCPCCHHGSR